MTATKQIFYAAVGAGDLAVERARSLQGVLDLPKLTALSPAEVRGSLERVGVGAVTLTTQLYDGLVERGERTVDSIRKSAPTRRAVAQSKTARSQTKAAVTSVRKAAKSSVSASKNAAAAI